MKKMTEERLVELRAKATDVRWMMGDSAPEMQEEEDAVGLADAVEEIDRLQEEVGALILAARMEVAKNEDLLAENERLTAAFAELLECHDVPGYVQLDKDFHERMSSVLGPEASRD